MLYSNYEAELFEQVFTDLNTYVELFNPVKEKINKRRRKLLDYDNAKHSYDNAVSVKKPDNHRIAKVSVKAQFCIITYFLCCIMCEYTCTLINLLGDLDV